MAFGALAGPHGAHMPKKLVVLGAQLECDQGTSPSKLVLQPGMALADDKPVANVMDFLPMANIQPFGMCKTQANPQVAAATTAAQGALTPQPCIPIVTAPWSPGSSVSSVDDKKLLTDDSTCTCQWAGKISIKDPATEHTTE
jgi:hypothetical protein